MTLGDGPLSFEWSKDGEILGSTVGGRLTLEFLEESDSGHYSVEIISPVSVVISDPIELTVTPFIEGPAITKAPQPQSISIGSVLSLSVVNSGQAPFDYSWFKDGKVIASTNDPFLLLRNVEDNHTGLYAVKISNPGGTVTSMAGHKSLDREREN